MDETTKIIKEYYNATVEEEWSRIAGRPEFIITTRFIDRYIKPGDKVLDIGGGPGRYSLYLAEKGCNVTLFDLSEANVKFALEQANAQELKISGVVGDARTVDEDFSEQFDHILLMGPMYHLLEEKDRIKAVKAALNLLKQGGTIFISFINMTAGMIFGMKFAPEIIASTELSEIEYKQKFISKQSFFGEAFTKAAFIDQDEIQAFMEQFPLKKLHFFGQESISSPCEDNIMNQPNEIVDLWMELFEKVAERKDLLSWSEHLMYVGRKPE